MPRQSTFCKDDAAGSAHEDTKEAKKQRRLIRNRLSAQMHRERQRAYINGLQNQVAALSAERDLWRQAFDTAAGRHCKSTGEDLGALLAGLSLPLAAEQVAPPPPPATGQSARGSDGADVMADLMDRAHTNILPRGRAAEREVASRTAARIVRTMASEEDSTSSGEARRLTREERRRRPKRRMEQASDESDDTEATAGRCSAAGSSDTDWMDGGSPAKRPALELAEVPGPLGCEPSAPPRMTGTAPTALDMDAIGPDCFLEPTLHQSALDELLPECSPLADVPATPVLDPLAPMVPHSLPPLPGIDDDPDEDMDLVGLPLLPPGPAMALRQVSLSIDGIL